MTEIREVSLADQAFCEERVLHSGHPLSVAQWFIPKNKRLSMVFFQALLQELTTIPTTVSDESVVLAKLAWWQQEINQCQQSQHPAIRGLLACGQGAVLADPAFSRLLYQLKEARSGNLFSDFSQLWIYCQAVGAAVADLECRLDGESPSQVSGDVAASHLFLGMILSLFSNPSEATSWWLPMDGLARHQLSRQDFFSSADWHLLVQELAEEVMAHSASTGSASIYQTIQSALDGYLWKQLNKQPQALRDQAPVYTGLGNLFRAWSAARQSVR